MDFFVLPFSLIFFNCLHFLLFIVLSHEMLRHFTLVAMQESQRRRSSQSSAESRKKRRSEIRNFLTPRRHLLCGSELCNLRKHTTVHEKLHHPPFAVEFRFSLRVSMCFIDRSGNTRTPVRATANKNKLSPQSSFQLKSSPFVR